MIQINSFLVIPDEEIEIKAIRAQGAGGQNVNKTATAIHLRFDIFHSSLPDEIKNKLLILKDQRISADGVIVIKAQSFRSQEMNKEDAIKRLRSMIVQVTKKHKIRRPTKPTRASQDWRIDHKTRRGKVKEMRRKVMD